MKRINRITGILLAAVTLTATSARTENESEIQNYQEVDIPLIDLPQAVMDAAQHSAEGIRLIEAEKITRESGVLYEVEGRVGTEVYEILVTPEGEILRVVEDD